MQINIGSSTKKFYHLLHDLAGGLGASFRQNSEQVNEATSQAHVATIDFSSNQGMEMRLRLELEKIKEIHAIRATLFLGSHDEIQEWSQQSPFLEALLSSRVLSEKCFPIAPALFSEREILWQSLLPFDDNIRKVLEDFILLSSRFYHESFEYIRHAGFHEELVQKLRSVDLSSHLLWSMRKWSILKNNNAQATEDISPSGHYYRFIPPTQDSLGMVAINLGNTSDFVGWKRILPILLKVNACTFLSDHYYIGLDGRAGLLLMALLPPCDEKEKESYLNALLKRAAEVRKFILSITTDLETAAIQNSFKDLKGVTDLVLI